MAKSSKKLKVTSSPLPGIIKPMLATLTKEVFNNEDWLYEVKWDGYRVVAHVQKANVTLRSREAQNYTSNYPAIVEALKQLRHSAVIDGEIVLIDEHGKPDFNELQRYNGSQQLHYYAFDLLWLDGESLLDLPLLERKARLKDIIPEGDILKFSEHFDDGITLYQQVQALELEGIIAKKKDSPYLSGKRATTWLKIKANKRQEFVIGGWTESENNQPFRSLVFGHYENGKFVYVHHGGGGFTFKQKQEFLKELKKIEVNKSPFVNKVQTETKVHWVKPVIVAEFEISPKETRNGIIRHPAIFKGVRTDKQAQDVVKELPEDKPQTAREAPGKAANRKKGKTVTSEDSNWPELENQKITSEEEFTIEGHQVKLFNVERELWKGITKADLIQYYHSVSSYILPHLKDRPLSLHIKNISPTAPGLYIKDMEGRQPEWAEIYTTERKNKKKGKRDVIDYLVCNNEATLLYLVNLGCIDINPWTARTSSALTPDYIVIDLDPSDDSFAKAIEAAKAAKHVFDKHKLTTFIKTSGKTGMHMCIPCEGFSFPQARRIAENICTEIHYLVPEITTTAVSINQRGNKLYLDPNQNDEADTIASAYSVRPFHLPTISTPLEWKEVNSKLNPHAFTIHNITQRIKKKGDLFKGVLDKKIARKNNHRLTSFL